MAPLSDEEADELDEFLLSDATSDETMTLNVLDGYLTAIVAGPVTIPASQWMPRIWGPTDEDAPEFESRKQARRILGLILRHMNGIVGNLDEDPDAFEPLMDIRINPKGEYVDGEMWAGGFMDGVGLRADDWKPLLDDPAGADMVRPLRLLGARELSDEEQLLVKSPEQREELSRMIPASVAAIYRFWLPYRQAEHERAIAARSQRTPKVGRNDPCPCGSGKKFKKCCGSTVSDS